MGLMRTRRWQKGVAASELAIALPILILVVGSVISIGRLAHLKLRLDSLSTQATRHCAMGITEDNEVPIEQCIQEQITAVGFDACEDLRVDAEVKLTAMDYEGLRDGEEVTEQVPWIKATVNCDVAILKLGNRMTDQTLVSEAAAWRN